MRKSSGRGLTRSGKLPDAMKQTVMVDELGRLVLPKRIREALGIEGRMPVNIEVVGTAARITTLHRAGGLLARKRGRLIYTGAVPADWDSGEAVFRARRLGLRRRKFS